MNLKNPFKNINALLSVYAVVLTIAFSRGVFEIFNAKIYGYALQLAALVLMAFVWLIFFGKHLFNKSSPFIYFLLLSVVSFSAVILTLLAGSNSLENILIVLVVNMLNLFFQVVALLVLKYKDIPSIRLVNTEKVNQIIFFLTLYVSTLSMMQYFGLIDFPGFWFIDQGDALGQAIRLSGPVGSKQHLSLLMSLICSLMITVYLNSKKLIHLLLAILCLVTLVLTFTRVGYLVLTVNLALYSAFYYKNIGRFVKSKLFLLLSFFSAAIIFIYPVILYTINSAFSRLFSITNTSELANVYRVDAISRGLEFFFSGPILVSDSLGSASQIPKQVLNLDVFHYETAQVQYLINFGLIFTTLVTAIFFRWAFLAVSSYKKPNFCSFVPFGLYAATFAYMYNEIVPIFVLMPMFSICIVSQSQAPASSSLSRDNLFMNS